MSATAFKFIPVQSAWYSSKLEEIAANIEIKRDRLDAQYQRTEMPLAQEERYAKLDEAWELAAKLDECLRDAEYLP